MRKSRHIDISRRLEATKQLGLLEDYQIDWPSNSTIDQPSSAKSLRAPRITVRGRSVFPIQVTKNYVVTLLGHLVPTRGCRDTGPLSIHPFLICIS